MNTPTQKLSHCKIKNSKMQNTSPQAYTVFQLTGEQELVQRLLENGITPGQKIILHQTMFLGEPLVIEVRGSLVALRLLEAECVEVFSEVMSEEKPK